MFTHQFFDLLLNLDEDRQVTEVEADHRSCEVRMLIEFRGRMAECPKTFELCSIYDRAPEREWRHLDTMQYKTYIRCKLPRVKNARGQGGHDSSALGL